MNLKDCWFSFASSRVIITLPGLSMQQCTTEVLSKWCKRWLVTAVSQRPLLRWAWRICSNVDMTDPHNLHIPLKELQLRLSSQTGNRGLCHWLYFGLKPKISDRKTVKLKGIFCMLSATRGFQFEVMEMKVTDKIGVS